MSEEKTNHAENLHKRLSLMENEINELNEILMENLDNSNKNKENYLNNEEEEKTINDQIDQDIDDLKNVILNDKIDFLDDLSKSKTPPLEQAKEQQKVNKNWAVYTNQEGRRIHEISVKQKIKELEQKPVEESPEMVHSYSKPQLKTNFSSSSYDDHKVCPLSPASSVKVVESPKVEEKEEEEVKPTKIETVVTTPPIQEYKLASTTKTKNPFRVVSVSKIKETTPTFSKSANSSSESITKQEFFEKVDGPTISTVYEETPIPNDVDVLLKLYDHICEKINKLGNEIEYVTNIIESRYSYSLTYDELKQFKKGKVILQKYLDKKYKQKYELENKISLKFRQLKLDDKMNSKLFFGNK